MKIKILFRPFNFFFIKNWYGKRTYKRINKYKYYDIGAITIRIKN
jgi:hypothetical protein